MVNLVFSFFLFVSLRSGAASIEVIDEVFDKLPAALCEKSFSGQKTKTVKGFKYQGSRLSTACWAKTKVAFVECTKSVGKIYKDLQKSSKKGKTKGLQEANLLFCKNYAELFADDLMETIIFRAAMEKIPIEDVATEVISQITN